MLRNDYGLDPTMGCYKLRKYDTAHNKDFAPGGATCYERYSGYAQMENGFRGLSFHLGFVYRFGRPPAPKP